MLLSWFGFHFFQISLICLPIVLVPLSPHWDRLVLFLRALVLSEEDVNASTYSEFLERTSLFSMLYKVSTVYLLSVERIFFFFFQCSIFLPFLYYAEIQYILFLVSRKVTNSFGSKMKSCLLHFLAPE